MRAEGIFVQSSKACATISPLNAEWSSLVARWAHNPKVVGSNPASATNIEKTVCSLGFKRFFYVFFADNARQSCLSSY